MRSKNEEQTISRGEGEKSFWEGRKLVPGCYLGKSRASLQLLVSSGRTAHVWGSGTHVGWCWMKSKRNLGFLLLVITLIRSFPARESQCSTPFPRSCPLSARFMPGLKI